MPTGPMMMMRMPIHLRNLRRRNTTIHSGAIRDFQLDRRMGDSEVILQLMIDPRQHLLALGQLHLHHLYMASHRMAL